jgi:dTDP-4-dehydrorhamnose 3,5-epimerase
MRFIDTDIAGVVLVEAEPAEDERGAFARLHCPEAFGAAGHPFSPAQTSLSRNSRALTLRGMHYKESSPSETKLVRVVRGRMFDVAVDVAVDLRPGSPTHRRWTAAELSAENLRALLIPEGVAHGFLTLEDETDVLYQISPMFTPGGEAGVRWDDPAFAIDWPARPQVISRRDAGYPDYQG